MKKLMAALAAAFLFASHGLAASPALLTAATTTGAGAAQPGTLGLTGSKTYQVNGATTSGSGSAVVNIEGSNDGVNWDVIGTVTLTLSSTTSSGSFTSLDRYQNVRGNVTTLTGTGASVNASQGY